MGGGCVVVFITKYQISISLHLCTGKSFIQGGEESDTDIGTYFMVWKLWPQIKDVEDKTMENIDFDKMEKKVMELCILRYYAIDSNIPNTPHQTWKDC